MKADKSTPHSCIVNWELHHKLNKTAEKTIAAIDKLVREGKIKIHERVDAGKKGTNKKNQK